MLYENKKLCQINGFSFFPQQNNQFFMFAGILMRWAPEGVFIFYNYIIYITSFW